jgi:hypothetical protein
MLGRDDLGIRGDVHITTDRNAAFGIKKTVMTNDGPFPNMDVPEREELAVSHNMCCGVDIHAQTLIDPLTEPRQGNPIDKEIAEIITAHRR